MTQRVRKGEYHEDEIIEVAGDMFVECHFYDCAFTGRGAAFEDCVIAGISAFSDLPAGSSFEGCLISDE